MLHEKEARFMLKEVFGRVTSGKGKLNARKLKS